MAWRWQPFLEYPILRIYLIKVLIIYSNNKTAHSDYLNFELKLLY
jgi:hypothetical protein